MCKRDTPYLPLGLWLNHICNGAGRLLASCLGPPPLHPSSKEKVKNCARANPATLRMQAR